MSAYPYKDMQNIRSARISEGVATTLYPSGVALGTSNPSKVSKKLGDTVELLEADCIFVAGGKRTPLFHAYIHKLVVLAQPSGTEQWRLDGCRQTGLGIGWDAGVMKLPLIDGALGVYCIDLGVFIASGFRMSQLSNSATAGEYMLIYELIPVKAL